MVYKHKDLLDFALKLYNNRKAMSKWNGSEKDQTKKSAMNRDTKLLAMMTNLEQLKKVKEMAKISLTSKTKTRDKEEGLGLRFWLWKFENKEEKETFELVYQQLPTPEQLSQ
eukprot:2404127-Ditylum_brightwellii.AAC.1